MPCLPLILWLASIVGLWVCVAHYFRETETEPDADLRSVTWIVILLAAGPPTAVFLVSNFVLMQAAPTVQFNAGSAWAMGLWSFWANWWPVIVVCSVVQMTVYLLWFVWLLVTGRRRWERYMVGWGFLSSLWGSILVFMAFPSA
jgi:hypothetical protein